MMRSKFLIVPFALLLAVVAEAGEPELKTEREPATACHGTTINFVESPVLAAKLAAKQKKLVLVVHVSGYFEDPNFT